MKVRKTTFEEEQNEKELAFFNLSPMEKMVRHQQLLKKIYGDRYNQPLSPEARIVHIKRG